MTANRRPNSSRIKISRNTCGAIPSSAAASRRFTHRTVRNLIEARTAAGWQFIYLSADLAAFADSDRIAIAESSRMAFDKNSRGTRYAFADLSRNIAESRSGLKPRAQAFFEESDRAKQDLETQRRGG